jgi:hypothetical protein
MKNALPALLLAINLPLFAQTNLQITHPLVEAILSGNYNGEAYATAVNTPTDPILLAARLQNEIRADSLKSYILKLSSFRNRNTGSDTLAPDEGVGAARRWVHRQFELFSTQQNNRLLPTYFQFDQTICSVGQHRNILAVLPGIQPQQQGIVIVEGHMDSRCDTPCDINCRAEGIEDNATGTALVMELARVMAAYQFNYTLVFMVTIGEEQGLYGANAFALYAQQKGLPVKAVLNNDVIGGIVCGQTSSAPSCPGLNHIDSTSVRLFSAGGFNSRNKQLARFIKLQYQENLRQQANVPMLVRIMSPEDRTGRGGDHIPFREKGFPAMRFTAANEHGDASNGPTYVDRQHTDEDILGLDTNEDGTIDSFFVDFSYLQRNACINANAAAIAARGVPPAPDFSATRSGSTLLVNLQTEPGDDTLRLAVRTTTNDWDTLFTVVGQKTFTVPCTPTGGLFVSLARSDGHGAESLFGAEKIVTTSAAAEPEAADKPIELYQNRPNPFDEATWIAFFVREVPTYRQAHLRIQDMNGREVTQIPVNIKPGLNEVLYTHGYGTSGTLIYTLRVDDRIIGSRQMVFAN